MQMIKKTIKSKKGITLVTLSIAIIIMLIITSTLIFNISTGTKVKALNDMYHDIEKLKDKVDIYYSKYRSIPVVKTKYENIENIVSINPNDNNEYYVIDLEALENITLAYGKDYGKYKSNPSKTLTDLYVMNARSHKVYYIKGIQFDHQMYYTIPEESTKVELSEILKLEVIGEGREYTDIQIHAVNKMTGIKKVTLMIDEQPYKTFEYNTNQREVKKEIEKIELTKEKRDCYFRIEDEENQIKTSNHITLGIAVSKLEAGDYIKYDTGVTSVGDNGIVMFRVLYPENSEYGLQIVSDKNIVDVTLGGDTWGLARNSYNNAIRNLNNVAEEYMNEKYAYDARCVGSIPTVKDKIFVDKDKGTETTVVLPPEEWTSYTKPFEWLSDDTGCYDTDDNYKIDEEALKKANIWITQENYWFASHNVHASSSYMGFDVNYANSTGELYSGGVCGVYSNGDVACYSDARGIRACILLKSSMIKITKGDGKSPETAYVIGL